MTSLSAGANAPLPDASSYTVRATYAGGHMDLIALLLDGAGNENDPVSRDALLLTWQKFAFLIAVLIY